MWFDAILFVVSVVAGAIAAVTGFGIGSFVTPAFTLQIDTRLAVAAVAIPHVVATALRLWLVRDAIDRRVLWGFGLTSAAGGLVGAMLHEAFSSRWLSVLFGALLLFVAISEATGLARRMRFHGAVAWIAGALSGLLGGLVGNQGGIRSAALTGFDLPKHAFVGTATAIALFVDGARVPIYLATQHDALRPLVPSIAVATLGVVVGTVVGTHVLRRIADIWFRRLLSALLAVLGVTMVARGLAQ